MAIFLIGGVVLAFVYGFWYALPILLIGIILTVGYVLFGTVQSSAMMMQSMDLDGAEQRLKLTLSPKYLISFNRAYYYMVKGTIAAQRKDMDKADEFFNMSLEAGLPGDNEKAMILLQQANIAGSKQKWNVAKIKMKEVKELNVTEPQIKEQIKEFEKALKQSGRIKGAQRQGAFGMRQGGRRMKRR